MGTTYDTVNVSVSNHILKVGSNSYPLRNITCTRIQHVQPDRSKPVWSFLGWCVLLPVLSLGTTDITVRYWILGIGFGVQLVRLVWRLLPRTVHQLVIETPGRSETAAESRDLAQIRLLAGLIDEAMGNPQAEFRITAENIHIGDAITQYGDHNTGKIARGES
ncbi:DUF6232 family protein [Kitasatospora purpeofusca]|uniref:DUF6232 family protein n=1 Tax=Kitasatospora purpeofusca TaxID=67352 RepID=UPI0033DC5234